jgi:hypothetical protein
MATSSINNMNIIVLIKEIFQTLKNLDSKYYSLEETLKQKINNVESKLSLLESKLQEITNLQMQIIELNKPVEPVINPNLEKELQNHLKELDGNTRLDLNLNEMTIANLIDNNYTVDEINFKIQSSNNKVDDLLFK